MTDSREPLHYIVHQSENAPAEERVLLIMLHGYGSNEQDLVGLAPYLDPRLLTLSVRAPLLLDFGSYAWFPLEQSASGIVPHYEEAQVACVQVRELVERLKREYAADRVFLLGFSQGASMAVAVGLADPGIFSGLISLSGFCVPEMKPEKEESVDGLPLFMTHGRWDMVIPIEQGRASHELLAQLPLEMTYKEYSMGHEINQECLEDLNDWLRGRLDGAV